MSELKNSSVIDESENIEQEITQSVLKDNTLNLLSIWTTVYIPYISIVDNVYEVRECIIDSIWDIVDNWYITLFYNCTVSNTWNSSESEKMTLNVLANVHTSYELAEKELKAFLEKQIKALTEHSETITKQLEKNKEHIEMFTDKIK